MALLLTHADIARLDGMPVAIKAMEHVYGLPPDEAGSRVRVDVPTGNGWLRIMAATIPGLGVFGYKAMNLAPGIGVRYIVSVYSIASGELLGVVDAREVTTMRTGACAAVATRRLARPGLPEIAVVGTGAEARAQLEAMHELYPDAVVRVFSRQQANRERFRAWAADRLGVQVRTCPSLADAVEGAGVVVLATKSPTPVLTKALVAPGVHVNSIGSARRDQYEIAADAFPLFSPVVCDSPEHVLGEAGDAYDAVQDGMLAPAMVSSLAQLVRGEVGGGEGDAPTLYKSVGTATQDVALAHSLLASARTDPGRASTELVGFPAIKEAS